MTQKKIKNTLPADVLGHINKLGERIRIARKRRRLTSEELARKMFVSRKTLFRLENGDPGISIGVLASALWALGLEDELLKLVDPELDKVGIFHERQRLPKRVRKINEDKLDF